MTATAVAVREPWITKPDLYELTDQQYHADPVVGGSASSTVLKAMLPPSCPAKAKHLIDQRGKPAKKKHYDIGSAFHAVTLGEGREIAVWKGRDWRQAGAADFRDNAYAAGKIPLTTEDTGHVEGMRQSVLRHPLAGALLEPGTFTAERTAVWRDRESGVMCRAKYDCVPHYSRGGRMTIVDLKSAAAADPASASRALDRYGYDFSGAHYRNGALALGLGDDRTEFVNVFVEKDPPYCVLVARLAGPALRRAEIRVRKALDLYAQCREASHWPGYSDDQPLDLDIPAYSQRSFEYDLDEGRYATSGDLL